MIALAWRGTNFGYFNLAAVSIIEGQPQSRHPGADRMMGVHNDMCQTSLEI
jgi:hypothetical protein